MDVWLDFIQSSFYELLVVVFFIGVGLCVDLSKFRPSLILLKSMSLVLFSNLIMLPCLIMLVGYITHVRDEIIVALIMIMVFPGGRYAIILSSLFRGNMEVAVTQFVTLRLSTILVSPFVFMFYASFFPHVFYLQSPLMMNVSSVLYDTFCMVLLPVICGALSRRINVWFSINLGKVILNFAYLYLIVMSIITSTSVYEDMKLYLDYDYLLIILFCILSILIPYVLARKINLTSGIAVSSGINVGTVYHIGITMLLSSVENHSDVFLVSLLLWGWVSMPMLFLVALGRWVYLKHSFRTSSSA